MTASPRTRTLRTPLLVLVAALLGACTAATPVGDPAEPPEALAARVARNAEAGLLDRLGGPDIVLDTMRGDAGVVEARGLRFRTVSTVPSDAGVIDRSFADYCTARGGRLAAKPNPVTLPAPTRGRTQPRRTTFTFCERPGGRPPGAGNSPPACFQNAPHPRS
jgi:hypothetical protein